MYISEGIPYGFTSAAMVAYLRAEGITLEQVGVFVAALFLPWSFKWAWAPLVDLFRFNRYGGRKAWIVACTVMIVLTLLTTAWLDLVRDFELLVAVVLVHNIFCATQDVAIDGLAVSTLKEDERGRGNGFMFGGQNFGILLGGAGAIAVMGFGGFDAALTYISVLMTLNLLFVVLFIEDPDAGRLLKKTTSLVQSLKTFFLELKIGVFHSGRGPQIGFLFSILPIATMALAFGLLTTIQVDYGLDEARVATVTGFVYAAAALGSIAGGWAADRYGLKKVIAASYVSTVFPTLLLASAISAVGLQQIPFALFFITLTTHGFCYGASYGTHAAVFMGMTNAAVGATMFTAYMAMGNLATSYTSAWQGFVAERFDYAMVLYLDALIMLIPLAVIPFLSNRKEPAAGSMAAVTST